MYFILLFFIELFTLFLLSKQLTRQLSYLFHRVTKNKTLTVYLLAVLFLPGTIIHELAHFLMAKILFVYAGQIKILPELQGAQVKLGSVQIAKTDPIRRFLIGASPFFFGTIIIIGTMFSLFYFNSIDNKLSLILAGYIIFEVGNTMFSSRKDMEGAIELLLVIVTITILCYLFGFRPSLNHLRFPQETSAMIKQACFFLSMPISIDLILIGVCKAILHNSSHK